MDLFDINENLISSSTSTTNYEEDVDTSLYIKQSLKLLGYNINNIELSNTDDNILNIITELIKQQRKFKIQNDESHDKIRTLYSNISEYELKFSNLNTTIEKLQYDLWDIDQKKRKLETESRNNIKLLKEQILRLTKENTMLQSKDTQYKHELRRKEKDYVKLQERLQQGIASANKEGKQGMEILNALKPNTKPKWKAVIAQESYVPPESLSALSIKGTEARLKEVIDENDMLRSKLQAMFDEWHISIENVDNQLKEIKTTNEELLSPSAKEKLSTAIEEPNFAINSKLFQLPVDMIDAELEATFQKNVNIIKRKKSVLDVSRAAENQALNAMKDELSKNTDNKAQLLMLISRIHEYRAIIEEQDQLIQTSLSRQNEMTSEDRRLSSMADDKEIKNSKHKIYSPLNVKSIDNEIVSDLDRIQSEAEMECITSNLKSDMDSLFTIPETPFVKNSELSSINEQFSTSEPATPRNMSKTKLAYISSIKKGKSAVLSDAIVKEINLKENQCTSLY